MLARGVLRGRVVRAAARRAVSSVERPKLPINLGVVLVPQQVAFVQQRFGKFHKLLEPGLHFLLPIVDQVAYAHSLKEQAIEINHQTAITRDNVTITIDGVLYFRVVDPKLASYGVSDAIFGVSQLAQTAMRSELGRITLDKTFEEREALNHNIVSAINHASAAWGVECLRYEIRDIVPPASVRHAMDRQAEAERSKRANILESEGERQAAINRAEGEKKRAIYEAEGAAQGTLLRAGAVADAIEEVSRALQKDGSRDAVALRVAEKYVEAFGQLAKEGTTVLLPSNPGDVSSMVAQAMAVFNQSSAATVKAAVPGKARGDPLASAALDEVSGDVKERLQHSLSQ